MEKHKITRSNRTDEERHARSQLAKLAHKDFLIKGGLVRMARTCGKPNCKCAKGQKHVSLYISLRHEGKRKMLFVPPQLEAQIESGIKSYKNMMRFLDIISDITVETVKKNKTTGHKKPKKD